MSQQINLYNPIFLKQKKIFSARTMMQALGVIVLAMLVFAGFARYQVGRLEAEVNKGNERVKAEEARLARFSAETIGRKKSAELENQIAQAQEGLQRREAVLGLLSGGALGETGGVSPYLRALARQNVNGLWLTGFEMMGREMTISGRALRAELLPEYLARLGREEVMRGRQFAMLEMQEPKAEADAKAKAVAPRYIEFALHSSPPKEAK